MSDWARIAIRYTAYLSFAAAALVIWFFYMIVVLGIFPFPVEPACYPDCPEPRAWEHALMILGIALPLPVTVLVFVFYRRWVRRLLGYQND